MTRTNTAGLLVALFAVVPLGGCFGGSDDSSDRDAVDQVMSDLQTASQKGDGGRICEEIFTPKLAALVSKSAKSGKCASEVKAKLFSPDAQIEVQSIDVQNASNATATVEEANGNVSTVFLVKQGRALAHPRRDARLGETPQEETGGRAVRDHPLGFRPVGPTGPWRRSRRP